MHKEILSNEQVRLLNLVKNFSSDFGLVGGTAIALQAGHRRSIDFDLLTNKKFDNLKIRKNIIKKEKIENVFIDEDGEYTILINRVKVTFFQYPFDIDFSKNMDGIKMPDLPTLAALKAFALGRRAKWKDYVDIYFITKDFCKIEKIIKKAGQIFGNEFNEKMFRAQLTYFKDIDYTEKIMFMEGFEVSDDDIKKELLKIAV